MKLCAATAAAAACCANEPTSDCLCAPASWPLITMCRRDELSCSRPLFRNQAAWWSGHGHTVWRHACHAPSTMCTGAYMRSPYVPGQSCDCQTVGWKVSTTRHDGTCRHRLPESVRLHCADLPSRHAGPRRYRMARCIFDSETSVLVAAASDTKSVPLRQFDGTFPEPYWLEPSLSCSDACGLPSGAVQTGVHSIVVYILDPVVPVAGEVVHCKGAQLRQISAELRTCLG
jgi:hypothetical protein